MKYLFQNDAGFQRGAQLVITSTDRKFLRNFEIRSNTDPTDFKQYQLTDKELVELRDLLNHIIEVELASQPLPLEVQQADTVE